MNASSTHTETLKRRNRELTILNEIAQALNREIDLSSALQTALGKVADLLDLDTGWIWLLHDETNQSYLAAAQNLPPALVNNPRSMEGSCYCLDTYREGDLDGAANVNVVKCSRLSDLVDGTDGLRYHASIPLYAHGKQLGVLNVASTDWRELSTDDLRLLYTIGDLLSIAIERARLFTQRAQVGAVEERNRLAREIHDTLAQSLAGIAMQLETADTLLETEANHKHIQEFVNHALELSRASLVEARRSVLDLRAAPLEGRTLSEALETLLEQIREQSDLDINYHATGANHPLPVRVEAGIYRVAQEAVTNVVQHASADNLEIFLLLQSDGATLTVKDDGVGFDPTNIPSGHYGLIGLSERVKLLEGTLNLQTNPGDGTILEVKIPL